VRRRRVQIDQFGVAHRTVSFAVTYMSVDHPNTTVVPGITVGRRVLPTLMRKALDRTVIGTSGDCH
jgi:hypothetical protein